MKPLLLLTHHHHATQLPKSQSPQTLESGVGSDPHRAGWSSDQEGDLSRSDPNRLEQHGLPPLEWLQLLQLAG